MPIAAPRVVVQTSSSSGRPPRAGVPLPGKMHPGEKKAVGEQRQRDRVQQREMHPIQHVAPVDSMRYRCDIDTDIDIGIDVRLGGKLIGKVSHQ